MDASKTEASNQSDLKQVTEASSSSDSSSVQESTSEVQKHDQPSETETDPGNTTETATPQHPDSTQAPQAEACAPNSKQEPPAGEKVLDCAAGDQCATTDAAATEAVEPPVPAQSFADPTGGSTSPGAATGTDSCYRYEGDTCIYTDPSSGVEYVYSADQDGWVRRDGGGDGQPVHAPTLENCYYVGEHYCFKDAAGTVYRLNPETNSWQEWSPPADATPAAAAGTDAAAEAAEAETAVTAGAAPAAGDDRCFRDSDGAWCCRDDTGALCRWDAAAGRWVRAVTDSSSGPGRRTGSGGRKRRLNRGSSDESEHDSDDDEPTAKRTPAVDGGRRERHEDQEPEQEQEQPSDGSGYEWDAERGAWFPKIDEEFLALHRLNYGFDSEGRAVETAPILEAAPPPAEPPPPEKQEAGKQRKLNTKKKPEWFQLDDSKNTKVYVSGLAEDTTEDEFVELMSKCGLVMKDPLKKNAWKIKLYRDDYGVPKGDGICTYIKIESVNLALSILDGYEFKGKKLTVEKASFDMKGQFDPSKKPKKKTLKKKDREKLQKKQEKLFAWQPDKIRGERERHERVVILKNLFSPEEFKTRPEAILEYQQDLRDECGKCGPVRKVVVNDRHKEGVAEVIFQEAADADTCVQKMNGRWFAGRRLEAATWDGKTKYRVEETEEERAERLAKWEKFISGEDKAGDKTSDEKAAGDKPPESKSTGDKPTGEKAAESTSVESKVSEAESA